MSNRPKNPANARNKNVLIVGGSGSGKTRFWLKPNLLQCHSSYVVTDPKGTVVLECGRALLHYKYRIKIFNTINFRKSMHYNPFAYIKKETDIMKVVDALMEGTTAIKSTNQDPFWIDAERLLYNALIGYIMAVGHESERNFSTLLDMVNAMEIRDDDENFKNAVDYMFDELKESDPDNYAVLQWVKFKQAAGYIR